MLKLDEKQITLARSSKKALKNGNVDIFIHEKHDTKVTLPKTAVRALLDALTYISEGFDVTVKPLNKELSSQKAADLLRVSRPFLIKMLENGEIPHRKVGTHRRVLMSDIEDYKRRIDEKRLKVLNELTAQAQDLGLGY